MLNVTEDIHTVLSCDFCSHKAVEIYVRERTSYTIEFICGMCGHVNKYLHSSSERPLK